MKARSAGDPAPAYDAERLRADQDLAWVLSDLRGRRALARILAASRWDEADSYGLGTDHARHAGQRDIGLALVRDIRRIDPILLPHLALELAVPAEVTGQGSSAA